MVQNTIYPLKVHDFHKLSIYLKSEVHYFDLIILFICRNDGLEVWSLSKDIVTKKSYSCSQIYVTKNKQLK